MRTFWVSVTAATLVVLGGCTPPYPVEAAPYASDPACAQIMLMIPTTVSGLPMRETTSQATAAWGDEYELVARCGVEPPGPTTDPCLVIETRNLAAQWVIREGDDAWVAITFGLTPALEFTVPKIRADEALGDVLAEVSVAALYAQPNGLQCR